VTKTELVKLVTDDTGQSRRKIIIVLERWCGDDYWKGHRWVCKTEDKNAKVYYPLKCPFLIGRE
jgi:hypothetical protein